MLREHRPTLADLLWERAQTIIKCFDMADASPAIDENGGEQQSNESVMSITIDDKITDA